MNETNRNNYRDYSPEIDYSDVAPVISSTVEGPKNNGEKPVRKERTKSGKVKKQTNQKVVKATTGQSELSISRKLKIFFSDPLFKAVVGIFLGLVGIYLLVSFISFVSTCIQDQTIINSTEIGGAGKVANRGGEAGARMSAFLINEGFGAGAFVIILWLFALSSKLISGWPRFRPLDFSIKCLVGLITLSLIIGITNVAFDSQVNWGGYHSRYVYEFINQFIGDIGSVLLCGFMVALFFVICLRDIINWIKRIHNNRKIRKAEEEALRAEEEAKRAARRRDEKQEQMDDIRTGEATANTEESEQDIIDEPPVTFAKTEVSLYELDEEKSVVTDSEVDSPMISATGMPIDRMVKTGGYEGSNQSLDASDASTKDSADKSSTMVVTVNEIGQCDKAHYRSQSDFDSAHPYKFPPFDLLREGVNKISVDEKEQDENQAKIEQTLLSFGIPITKISATVGPTVTLYEIVPDSGVKISKIRSLVDDIALSLSARGVRIIAPIPGRGTVGIEVANKDALTVSMRTVIRSQKFQSSKFILPVAMGSTISNEVYIADLAKMPHLLVAGATGQGKSVGLNAIVASLLYSKSPSELKFVMIDPKQVEFSLYNKLKDHYMAVIPEDQDSDEPVITDMQKVEATLNSLCIEMDDRYTLLKNAHARNVEEYNEKIKAGKLDPRDGHRFLPYIVVIVDEFGDLIMVSGKNVEMPIARLAQKARAVGMHVIIATQRPSTNVITGIIKANFPARISFKVSSGVDSKTILDTTGAQQLIGRGDMLIFHNSEMVRVQCAFIDTPEVEALCDYVEKQPYPQGVYLLPEPRINGEEGGNTSGPVGDRDPLFEEIARRVVSSNTASTSALQRSYSIGYNRAGKIMDQLEACGIVGPSQGGKPRAVLIDSVGLESILDTL